MRDFRQLLVWQKAHELTLEVYRVSRAFPAEEKFGLTGQLRRSAASVPTNLAEGSGRRSRAEYAHFVGVACGSALETEYHLLLASDLGYLTPDAYQPLDERVQEIKRMLAGLSHSLKSPNP
ncbi:four helix bundle protein [Deinococcus xinjiangensis]|uniref:four helix bundle protein n=1 Tax=Deinococcus xinjiangensis TaxID=457454 RepID=UPI003365875D